MRPLLIASLMVLMASMSPVRSARAMDVVHFDSAQPPISPFKKSRMKAEGTKPDAAQPIWGHLAKPKGSGPFPALVLMHGCNGIHSSHARWAKLLNELGYVTLITDSFRPRSIFSVCTSFSSAASPPVRALDAQGALTFLQGLAFVDAERIGVIGWSHGGMSALAAVSQFGMTSKFPQRFKMAIAFYPYCYGDQTSKIPALILIGEADDWTPLSACEELKKQSKQHQLPLEMVVYPGAYHAFDDPALETGFSLPGADGQMHFLEYNEAAHADSKKQVELFLANHLSK